MNLVESYQQLFIFIAAFTVVVLAARQIGQTFSKARLPLITGFLFTGILTGPFILNFISADAVKNLRFVDEISLAFIAFVAGSKFYLKDLKGHFKSIRWATIGLVLSTFTLGSLSFFVLLDVIPFMRTLPATGRVSASILAGAILVARSPSSAVAIVNELRAKGPFTKTVLGVTVIMDVVVITLFAVNSSIADALISGLQFNISFVFLLIAELILSLVIGYALGKTLEFILFLPTKRLFKTGMILVAGYGIFVLSSVIRISSKKHLPFEVLLEPLLICMIASFITINFSKYRAELLKIFDVIGLPIYIAFFTLTGASLALDILVQTWPIALALFAIRLVALFIGSMGGGMLAGDPMKHNRIYWMGYITQAGISLGLAKEVAIEFPRWGAAFATIIISVIVMNQIVGPPFFKWAIHIAEEARPRAETLSFDGTRDVLIFGLEGQSLALARMLNSQGWEVKIACTQVSDEKQLPHISDIDICPVSDLSLDTLTELGAGQAEAIVTMLSDEENYQICELAYEHLGTQNLVVRLNSRTNLKRFHEFGALIVDPSTAMVNLLDQFVRSPSAASLFLGLEKEKDIIEFELRNPDLHEIAIRDLSLPLDILILSVRRHGQMIMSHGYTTLAIGDWVTAVGSKASLEQVMLRFDANREYEVVHLVERVTPTELTGRSLETEVKQIIRDRADIGRDRFDKLIEESLVIDIDQAVGYDEFFRRVSDTMSEKLNCEADTLFQSLMDREKESSTAFRPTLALPHIIIEGEKKFSILLARCKQGIHFSELAPRVHAVFVLVGTKDERNYHLRALSAIAEIVQSSKFEKQWLKARDTEALREAVLLLRKKRIDSCSVT